MIVLEQENDGENEPDGRVNHDVSDGRRVAERAPCVVLRSFDDVIGVPELLPDPQVQRVVAHRADSLGKRVPHHLHFAHEAPNAQKRADPEGGGDRGDHHQNGRLPTERRARADENRRRTDRTLEGHEENEQRQQMPEEEDQSNEDREREEAMRKLLVEKGADAVVFDHEGSGGSSSLRGAPAGSVVAWTAIVTCRSHR